MEVFLYVYDLSQGLASSLSLGLLGIQVDAVYHTSIVLGDREHFFGRGIQSASPPGSTQYGSNPIEIKSLGVTELPMDVILEFLELMREEYHQDSYHILTRNCNHFTNEFAEFLLGSGIPAHIVSLPETVMNTPFGQMLLTRMHETMVTEVNQ